MSGGTLPPIAESPYLPRKRKRSSDAASENIFVANPLTEDKPATLEGNVTPPETKKQLLRRSKRSSISSNEEAVKPDLPDNGSSNIEATDSSHEAQNVTVKHVDGTSTQLSGEELGATEQSVSHLTQDLQDSSANSSEHRRTLELRQSDASESNAEDVSNSVHSGDASMDDGDLEGDEGDDEEGSVDSQDEAISASQEAASATLEGVPTESMQASPAVSPPESNVDQDSPVKRLHSAAPNRSANTVTNKPIKKLPGRRRAPHANPKVEAALRRQLHLRMAYRAVAKTLKPLLAELTRRSLNEIEKDEDGYTQTTEYPVVKEGLHQRFEHRLAWIQKQKELSKKRLNDILAQETEMRKQQHENIMRNIKEDYIVRLQHDFLMTLRKQQQEQDGHASDDEGNDVVPALRRVTLKGAVGSILGPEYHWRSRPAVETERLFNELQGRNEVAEEHKEHDGESATKNSRPFTTFDPVYREAALAKRKIDALMEALEHAQEEPAMPVVPVIHNDQAVGLQILAAASTAPPVVENKTNVESKVKEPSETLAQSTLKVPTPKPTVSRLPEPSSLSVPKPSLSRAQDRYVPALTSQSSLEETRWPAEPRIWPKEQTPVVASTFGQVVLQSPFLEPIPLAATKTSQLSQASLSAPPTEQGYQAATQAAETSMTKPERNDFWSRLARGETTGQRVENGRFDSKEISQPNTAEPVSAGAQRDASIPGDSGSASAGTDQNLSHSRPSLPGSSTVLEPLSQRLRSTSDSFGSLLNGPGLSDSHNHSREHKGRASKKSMWGPWPRGRNYDPFNTRRASIASSGSQEGYPRPMEGFGPTGAQEYRHQPYSHAPQHPGPGYSTSGAHPGGYPPPPIYAPPPPPPAPQYGYDQRGPAYQPPPYSGPTGFPSLPGAPMPQPPMASNQYYAGHQAPPQAPYQAPPLTSRPPPIAPAYGPQYGGQPILPATSHDPRYGHNGAPPPGGAGPAFAQYQNNDVRKRRNQSFGGQGGEFRHYYGPR
ncbi:hypothetical protein MBLNU459_g3559t1 [Dothideomycetes sp. NU459]